MHRKVRRASSLKSSSKKAILCRNILVFVTWKRAQIRFKRLLARANEIDLSKASMSGFAGEKGEAKAILSAMREATRARTDPQRKATHDERAQNGKEWLDEMVCERAVKRLQRSINLEGGDEAHSRLKREKLEFSKMQFEEAKRIVILKEMSAAASTRMRSS